MILLLRYLNRFTKRSKYFGGCNIIEVHEANQYAPRKALEIVDNLLLCCSWYIFSNMDTRLVNSACLVALCFLRVLELHVSGNALQLSDCILQPCSVGLFHCVCGTVNKTCQCFLDKLTTISQSFYSVQFQHQRSSYERNIRVFYFGGPVSSCQLGTILNMQPCDKYLDGNHYFK